MASNVKYETLMAEIDRLRKQADLLRINDVIEDIKAKVKEYGLSPKDIFDDEALSAYTPPKVVHTRKKPDVKFKDPVTGATWTGRGKVPKWMQGVIEKGGSKDDFAV